MSEVADLEQEIRRLINKPRLQHELLRQPADWYPLCSSLDTIGDIEVAIDSYKEMREPEDLGQRYLLVYGLLQTLVVQQDAVHHLSRALKISFKLSADLKSIRNVRVAAVGHPTTHRHPKTRAPTRSAFISRGSLSTKGFQLFVSDSIQNSHKLKFIDVHKLINKQRKELTKKLRRIKGILMLRENAHRKKFRRNALSGAFHKSTAYLLQKVFSATIKSKNHEARFLSGKAPLQMIKEMVGEFRQKIDERGLLHVALSDIDDTYYAISRLEKFFDRSHRALRFRDAYIFTFYLQHQIEDLRRIAKEIDDEYARNE